jgi:hypothetical protein
VLPLLDGTERLEMAFDEPAITDRTIMVCERAAEARDAPADEQLLSRPRRPQRGHAHDLPSASGL